MKKVCVMVGCLFLVLLSGLASAVVNINGTTITFSDGTTQDSAGVVYTRIVVVPADGADAANGTALLSALAGITTAAADNRFLLQLEPGTYDLGSGLITMKPFVDLAGSGLHSSTVTSSGGLTVALSNDSEVRHVELIQTGSDSDVVFADGVTNTMYRVRLENTATSGSNTAGMFVNSNIELTQTEHVLLGANSGTSIGIFLEKSTMRTYRLLVIVDNAVTEIGVEVEDSFLVPIWSEVRAGEDTTGTGISLTHDDGVVPKLHIFYTGIRGLVPVAANDFEFSAASSQFRGGSTGLGASTFVNCYNDMFEPITNTLASVSP